MPEVGADEYRDTMDAVGYLAGEVGHHLNNLLTVVEGNASFLEDELGNGRFASEVQDIRDACRWATDLSKQLLAISGHRRRRPRVLDLRTFVSGMDLGRFFSGDTVFCADFATVMCPVRVDPAHLEAAVIQLVLNAKEAVDRCGTVLVRIESLPGRSIDDSLGAGGVHFEVSDSGRGMDRGTLNRVFHPYFSTRPLLEDRGLGLSVADWTVRENGGTMKVSSASGCGSTVRVWFPALTFPDGVGPDSPGASLGP